METETRSSPGSPASWHICQRGCKEPGEEGKGPGEGGWQESLGKAVLQKE